MGEGEALMDTAHNVFISWSGERSLAVAKALRAWLPKILQVVKPWMSDTEIEKGSRGINEVVKALGGMRVGISCLTPENLAAPWLLFEAGALSKSIDDKTRLCTYLFGGLHFQDVQPPLSMFQATNADREDTRKLVHAINKAVQDAPISESNLDELFDAMWPNLEKSLISIPMPEQRVEVKRSVEDMTAEILDWARAEPQRRMDFASDITNRLAGSKPTLRPTLDLKVNIGGKPLIVEVGGLPELLKPMVTDFIRKHLEKTFEKRLAAPEFDAVRENPEFQNTLRETIDDGVETVEKELANSVESSLSARELKFDF
jgi:hypothetical protein